MAVLPPESARNGPPPAANHRNPWSSAATPSEFIHGTFKGEPSITIPKDAIASLAARFGYTLIGKFSQGKPSMELIRKFISIQNFAGSVFEGFLDKKHVVFRFELSADYVRFFSKPIWNVFGKSMRILKWTPDFHFDREPSIVPIWLCLPKLPLHLINEDFIFSLVSSFSKPLQIDTATERLRRPSVARIQVEFDLLEMLPSRVWIQYESGRGFWQPILLEDHLPSYCRYCWHIGHEEHNCTVKYPETLQTFTHIHREFRPKQRPEGYGEQTSQYGSQINRATAEEIIYDREAALEKNFEASTSNAELKNLNKGKALMDQSTSDEETKKMQSNTNAIADMQSVVADFQQEGAKNGESGDCQQEGAKSALSLTQAGDKSEVSCSKTDGMHQTEQVEQEHEKSDKGKEETVESPFQEEGVHLDSALKGLYTPEVGQLVVVNDGKSPETTLEDGNQVIEYSEGCPISNPFEALSIPLAKKAQKSSGIDSLDPKVIQAELRYMCLDPKVQLGEYISDKVFEEKFTPAKKSTRIRTQKKIFDL